MLKSIFKAQRIITTLCIEIFNYKIAIELNVFTTLDPSFLREFAVDVDFHSVFMEGIVFDLFWKLI